MTTNISYDFSFFLAVASLVTGVVWGGYLLALKLKGGIYDEEKAPPLVEYSRSFFPILMIVLLVRTALVEPYRIPSESMMPTLLIGDFILVNKFAYGIRLPITNLKIVDLGEPKRGDIFVFRYPKNPTINYIKRVIGLPGDRIEYYDKKLRINGVEMNQASLGIYQGIGEGINMTGNNHFLETLTDENSDKVEHGILVDGNRPTTDNVYLVPKGSYFAMGDNRDNSNDSRYWGIVPEENLVGRAFFIWMSWDWQDKGVGFDRIGKVLK